jgi:AcrR family transcriptional regulator
MRRLADELGVGTMTLYGYFRSKRELLGAVLDVAVPHVEAKPDGGPWRDRLRAIVMTARESLVRHPALVQVRVREPVLRAEALSFAETGLQILMEAGFDAEEATRAFRLIFTYAFGYAAFSPSDAMEQNREAARAAIAALPPERYPALTASREEAAAAMAGEEAFEYGLDRILDGLEVSLGR